MRVALYVLWQCTWGCLQSALGLLVFAANVKKPHAFYHGAVVTGWKGPNSVSLGLFLFVADNGDKRTPLPDRLPRQLLVHEYGHTVQSLVLGPLYLPVIGLPSALWCSLPGCKRLRKEKRIPYSAFYTEKWADRWGKRTLGDGRQPPKT